mgnify:CR=1
MGLGSKVVDLSGLNRGDDVDEVGRVGEICMRGESEEPSKLSEKPLTSVVEHHLGACTIAAR